MSPKILVPLLALLLLGCARGPKSAHGFRLPDGDVARGQAAFVALDCALCHSVEGVELPAAAETRPFDIHLGGKVLRVRTYGELVTAIVYPSHDLAAAYEPPPGVEEVVSPMADFNATMTVQQLIDLVAFLQSTYRKYLPEDYDPYFP